MKTAEAMPKSFARPKSIAKKVVRSKPLAQLDHLYSLINKHRGLASGTPDSPIYGENNRASLSRAFRAMGLDEPGSVFCDVGSGAGAPSLQAACEYPGLLAYGFEVVGIRWWISQTILAEVLKNRHTSEVGARVLLAHADLRNLPDFGPCTHVFAFDTGFPTEALGWFADAFNRSQHVRVLACFHQHSTLLEAGFVGLGEPTSIEMRMFGSGESKRLLLYPIAPRLGPVGTGWDLTKILPPTERKFQPSVAHSTAYACGEEERAKGPKTYAVWLADQIGFARSDRVTTRSASRSRTII